MHKFVITGNKSGLGRYLHENLSGLGFDRDNLASAIKEIKRKGTNVIIHCAFNPAKTVDARLLYSYLYDNVLLTKELTLLPHKKFIFISTVDVYPKNNRLHTEKENIDAASLSDLYAITKLMSEAIVKNNCCNYLILRPTAMLGKYSRKNSLISILEDKRCTLSLSGKSSFNYVLHSDILEFIRYAIGRKLQGVYNIASSRALSLSQIAEMSGNRVKFGKYNYYAGNISNKKVISTFKSFNKTSKDVIRRFIEERL